MALAEIPVASTRPDELTNLSFQKARRLAMRRVMTDLIGVCLDDPTTRDRVRIVGVDSERVLLADAHTGDPLMPVGRDGWPTLLSILRESARSRDTRTGTMLFVIAGEGERVVTDWPLVVLMSGRTVPQIERDGVAYSILHPKKSSEAW